MNPQRAHTHPGRVDGAGPVLYWMHREHRVADNWGLLHARELARDAGAPLIAAYCLAKSHLGATLRQYDFLLAGLREAAEDLDALGIPLHLVQGDPAREMPALAAELRPRQVVADFDPLRPKRGWIEAFVRETGLELREVDSRNVVPCRAASDKREYAARTIRPKIHRLLPEFLEPFPELEPQAEAVAPAPPIDWEALRAGLEVDNSVAPVAWPRPGARAGRERLRAFLDQDLARYADERNDPTRQAQSGLSPYLHFGMVSAQRVALEVGEKGRSAPEESRREFLEELVVRRELAENYCFHTPEYDSLDGLQEWGRITLEEHRDDPREQVYSLDELESARTHDPLWNAAQCQMLAAGVMPGYLRMYWAKKILEWTGSPEEAMAAAVRLNDRYLLDGRDPNGYAGIAWSIGGLHDQPFKERPVFGKVRYMNFAGAKRKFDVNTYISAWGECAAGGAR